MTLSFTPVHLGHRIISSKPLTVSPLLPRSPRPVKREPPVNRFSESFTIPLLVGCNRLSENRRYCLLSVLFVLRSPRSAPKHPSRWVRFPKRTHRKNTLSRCITHCPPNISKRIFMFQSVGSFGRIACFFRGPLWPSGGALVGMRCRASAPGFRGDLRRSWQMTIAPHHTTIGIRCPVETRFPL